MIAVPPVTVGAVQLSTTEVSSAVPDNAVGVPGVVTGVTAEEAEVAVPVPTAFTALTRKV